MNTVDRKDERFWWLALSKVPGVGPLTFLRLIKAFGSPREVFLAQKEELIKLERVGPAVAQAIKEFKIPGGEVLRELQRMDRLGIRMLTYGCDEYPASLAAIPDPPPILFIRGRLVPEDRVAVAIVGSRAASQQGLRVTYRLAKDLAAAGVTIVSGMARGIDSEAHRGALAGGGRTIAVLGCGLNVIYPPENRELFFKIIENGAVVSEYCLDVTPDAVHFPNRNRIISGLALGVTVVEAAPNSGSLITARLALEQGREVFAVPGQVDSMRSRGTNRLIRQGAKLVEFAGDILEELAPVIGGLRSVPCGEIRPQEELSDEEKVILYIMENGGLHMDEIVERSGMSPAKVCDILLHLEFKGLIRQMPGKWFERSDS